MRILYIYPHPDDESFGTAHAMSKQSRQGHEVYLLTLTRGGATKQRIKFNFSIEEMGEVRYQEMLEVAKVLNLTELRVLDLPDSGLKEMDPREIEEQIKREITRVLPDVIATYAVHGISGFHDHLVTHAVVKHCFVDLKGNLPGLKRLAFHTISEEEASQSQYFQLKGSTEQEIDCKMKVDQVDIHNAHKALDCYVTFEETIKNTNIKEFISSTVLFELYQENFDPPLQDLFESLP